MSVFPVPMNSPMLMHSVFTAKCSQFLKNHLHACFYASEQFYLRKRPAVFNHNFVWEWAVLWCGANMKSFSGVFTVSLATECFAFLGHLRQDQSIVKGDCAKKKHGPWSHHDQENERNRHALPISHSFLKLPNCRGGTTFFFSVLSRESTMVGGYERKCRVQTA